MHDLQKILKDLEQDHPLVMGRYLTQEERADIRRRVPDTGPDWPNWNPVISEAGWSSVQKLGPLLTKVLLGKGRKDEGYKF